MTVNAQQTHRFTVGDVLAAREELARRRLGRGIPSLVDLLQPARYKGAWGGRGSGKSHTMAEMAVLAMLLDPDCSVVCVREIQKSLTLSAKKLIEDKITQFQLGHLFDIQATMIRRRGGKGMCIFQGMQDHTAESIKSLEGFKIAWCEEAQSLSERSLRLLRPTMRAAGSEIWFSWNPRFHSDAVEKLLRSKKRQVDTDRMVVRRANYTDNPFCPPELLEEAEDDKFLDPEGFDHTWLGGYENMSSKLVVPQRWFEAAIGLAQHLGLEVTGKKVTALDVAGGEEGGDENCWSARHGIELQALKVWNGMDTALTTQNAIRHTTEFGANEIQYDSASVGEGVTGEWGAMGRRGERPKGMKMVAWNGGSAVLDPDKRTEPNNPQSPINKDQYMNLKAQAWFAIRKRFENAYKARNGRPYDPELLISISPDIEDIEELGNEMSQPQHKPSGTGKTMVDKAPDNKPSPNRADSVVMNYFPLPAKGYDWAAIL